MVEKTIELDSAAASAASLFKRTRQSLGRVLIDLDEVISQVLIAVVANGHALLEGVPGTAKTTLCRGVAQVLGMNYNRIQFTPDLLPSDVTGTRIFDQRQSQFVLQRGPIFCQLLLSDELNRAPARTQSALLEAMQERQVTIEGETLTLPVPFIVLATQNPIEQEGVYRLPEAQLDRFLFRVQVGYPDRSSEISLLELQEMPVYELEEVCTPQQVIDLQRLVDRIHVSDELKTYIVDLVRGSRQHDDVLLGASPRSAIFLLKATRTRTLLRGATFATHDDVQAVVNPCLEHRIIMRPEAELSGRDVRSVLQELVQSISIR